MTDTRLGSGVVSSTVQRVRVAARRTWLPVLLVALALSVLVGVAVGPLAISPLEIWNIVLSRLGFGASVDAMQSYVLLEIRLPRVVVAALVGSSLALAGAALQGLYRNPLADPGLIGVSAGAALAAALATVGFGVGAGALEGSGLLVPVAAFVGGVLATALVYVLSRVDGQVSVSRMLLVGIAVNALVGALLGLIVWGSTDAQLRALTLWRLGSLGGATWTTALLVAPFALLGWLLVRHAPALNALALGEREAGLLGVGLNRLRLEVVALVALCVAAAVAFCGLIGFVGLIAPHLVRLLLGADQRRVLVASPLFGASLLVLADTVARTARAPAELPIGVITALLGAPVFVLLLRRRT